MCMVWVVIYSLSGFVDVVAPGAFNKTAYSSAFRSNAILVWSSLDIDHSTAKQMKCWRICAIAVQAMRYCSQPLGVKSCC